MKKDHKTSIKTFKVGSKVEFLTLNGNFIKGTIENIGHNVYWYFIKTDNGNIREVHYSDIYYLN